MTLIKTIHTRNYIIAGEKLVIVNSKIANTVRSLQNGTQNNGLNQFKSRDLVRVIDFPSNGLEGIYVAGDGELRSMVLLKIIHKIYRYGLKNAIKKSWILGIIMFLLRKNKW